MVFTYIKKQPKPKFTHNPKYITIEEIELIGLELLFKRLLEAAGERNWWPCDRSAEDGGRSEVIIGAILTQHTTWKNVEKSIDQLKQKGLLSLEQLSITDPETVAPIIRASGYPALKAARLHAVARFFAPNGTDRYDFLTQLDDQTFRKVLLDVHGVGPETADSILLYAFNRPVFVIDAYTLRMGIRYGLLAPKVSYAKASSYFMERGEKLIQRQKIKSFGWSLTKVFQEYHALFVWLGQNYCKATQICEGCPVFDHCIRFFESEK